MIHHFIKILFKAISNLVAGHFSATANMVRNTNLRRNRATLSSWLVSGSNKRKQNHVERVMAVF